MDDFMVLCLVVGLVCGILGMVIGSSRDREGMGFLLGFLLGPIGLLIVAVLMVGDRR